MIYSMCQDLGKGPAFSHNEAFSIKKQCSHVGCESIQGEVTNDLGVRLHPPPPSPEGEIVSVSNERETMYCGVMQYLRPQLLSALLCGR
jgi:hypothetical protein